MKINKSSRIVFIYDCSLWKKENLFNTSFSNLISLYYENFSNLGEFTKIKMNFRKVFI